MILYGSSLSPFVRKTLAYIAEKGIEVESRWMAPQDQNPEFRECSPFGKIPAFRDGDFTISDSSAIITYLEAGHPSPALLPADPKARARVVWFDEFADTIVGATLGKIFFNRVVAPLMGQEGDLAAAAAAEKDEVPPLFDYVESQAPAAGFLVGDSLTLADLAVASPFVNLAHAGVTVDAAKYPKIAAWLAQIHARPSFANLIAAEKKFLGR